MGGGEVLPKYVPQNSHDDTRAGSNLGDVAIPTERLPGYDASHPREGAALVEGESERRETVT